MEIPLETRNKTTICAAIPLLGIYLEKTITVKGYMNLNVNSNTVYNSQDMEAT